MDGKQYTNDVLEYDHAFDEEKSFLIYNFKMF